MGSMGTYVRSCPTGLSLGRYEVLLDNYHAGLREALRTVLEQHNASPTDPRVHALNAHLSKRHAAYELREQLRERHQQDQQQDEQHQLRRQLLDQCFRGVNLQYATTTSTTPSSAMR